MSEKPETKSRELASMQKNAGERLVLRETIYRGYRFLDLRTDFCDKAGEYHPTRKGVSLSLDQWAAVLPVLHDAMADMESATS